ncbi:MAG: biopolymer transporter ExbD [Polyangia bacterium]
MAIKRRETGGYEGDPLIPILNLVCMLIPLLLYGAVFVRFMTLTVNAPKISRAPSQQKPKEQDALNLTVMITDQGFHFKVNPKHRLPWMSQATETASSGPDIPKKDDDWDFKELNRKLKEIKDNHREEQNLILGAEDDIKYEVLIKAMDFSRGTPEDPLFPVVTLTRGVV